MKRNLWKKKPVATIKSCGTNPRIKPGSKGSGGKRLGTSSIGKGH